MEFIESLRANITDPTMLYVVGAVVLIIGLMILRRVIFILIFFIIIGTALVVLTPDRKATGSLAKDSADQAKGIAMQVAEKIQTIRDTFNNFQETQKREEEILDDKMINDLTK